jgi:hypothetical protein
VSDHHIPLRDRLTALATHHDQPRFETSQDPTLVAFAGLFADSGLSAFDANKHLRTGALSPIYDCETESQATPDSESKLFVAIWTPVWGRTDPVTGFRTGRDSVLLGTTPTVAMPQDERTAALLLLVTTTFVHLSGTYADGVAVVEGAAEADDGRYRFVKLDAALVPQSASTPPDVGRSQAPAT